MTNSIVLGLDGANWNLLKPWINSGDLPNIASLIENGIAKDMESCLPPTTCPNWRCYTTGKNPGKLGVFWWERINTESQTLETPNSRSFKSSNFWDYFNAAGYSTGIMNIPMTYPPYDVDGFMISGGPGGENTDYTYPPELEAELDAEGYKLQPKMPITSKDDYEEASRVVDLIDERLQTFRRLLKERQIDFGHCTVFYINALQHYFWRGEPTKRGWEVIDEHIGAIRRTYPDATLYLMSDHGCAEIDTVFYANAWLVKEGYQTRTGVSGKLANRGINKVRIQNLAKKYGVSEFVKRIVPENIKNRIPEDEHGFKREQKLNKIDWDSTQAIASGQGLIYTMPGAPTEEIVEKLKKVKSPETGKKVAVEVYKSDEIYSGEYVNNGPDIIFQETPGVSTSGAIGQNPVFDTVSHWSAENVRTGLFLAEGPNVETNTDLSSVSITDVFPTLLLDLDCAIPEGIDGEPLEIFGDKQVSYRDSIPFQQNYTDSESKIQDRLQDLGYLE